ncbi:TOBE domain-containing protein [Massilia sp. BSC265]|uniref:TOBE domain-containing protein n=1 Tax=Massilia sp. BSC265 TaxID=1549812 RepID=UPI0004E88348|nr:TOBE domain-containing protein [Massilia sp. BSC265]KFI05385.1 ModE family transcriptional regulator [Massilia sp. BSC265]
MEMENKDIALGGSLWMTVSGAQLGGSSRVALLAEIAGRGSITQAAKAVGMSYKAAWDAIDAMNNLAGEPLVERLAGGKGGGGTRLTARGAQLVENFRLVEQLHREFVDHLNRRAGGIAGDLSLLRRLNMKTSARNQFFGTVSRVRKGAVNDEVELAIAGDWSIVAVVTHESAESLGLEVGAQAFALVKSSSVMIMADDDGVKLSARNRLSGRVARLLPGAVNTEVVIDLGGGSSVAAVITNESARLLELQEGSAATAIFKASSVILGIPA